MGDATGASWPTGALRERRGGCSGRDASRGAARPHDRPVARLRSAGRKSFSRFYPHPCVRLPRVRAAARPLRLARRRALGDLLRFPLFPASFHCAPSVAAPRAHPRRQHRGAPDPRSRPSASQAVHELERLHHVLRSMDHAPVRRAHPVGCSRLRGVDWPRSCVGDSHRGPSRGDAPEGYTSPTEMTERVISPTFSEPLADDRTRSRPWRRLRAFRYGDSVNRLRPSRSRRGRCQSGRVLGVRSEIRRRCRCAIRWRSSPARKSAGMGLRGCRGRIRCRCIGTCAMDSETASFANSSLTWPLGLCDALGGVRSSRTPPADEASTS